MQKNINIMIGIIIAFLLLSLIFKNIAPIIWIVVVIAIISKMKKFELFKKKPKKKKEKEKIVDVPGFDFKKKLGPYFILYAIVLIAILYYFRPWIHELIMGLYTKPIVVFFVAFLLITIYLFTKKSSFATFFVVLTVLSFMVIPFTTIIEQRYIVMENDYNKIGALPDTTDIRILPRVVAFRYLEDSLQKSREKVGGINIVNVDDDIFWMAPRIPDGFILYLTEKVNGVMTADASKTDRTTKMISKRLEIGEDIGIFDNIYWNLFKKRYFVNLGDIYYIYKNDRVITIAPIIAYKFKFPVMVPYYDGLFVLDEEGKIFYYNPSQVKEQKEFEGNRAYPSELARLYVDSYKYNLGVINTWFLHKDQIEISDVYGRANRQPFLMPTTGGLKWIIATEPFGESYGVFKIFLVDALTGRIDMLELDEDQTLTGPVRVISYVKKKFPRIDWSTTKIVEPRPFVISGKLYWMLSITPADYAGIAYTVFVNSENNEVIAFENDEGVYNFVKKGIISEVIEDKDQKTKGELIDEKISEIEKILEEIKELK